MIKRRASKAVDQTFITQDARTKVRKQRKVAKRKTAARAAATRSRKRSPPKPSRLHPRPRWCAEQ